MSEQVICQCCGAYKQTLVPKGSKIIKGNILLLCNTCMAEGHEPTHFIMIGVYSNKDVDEYIAGGRYCGELSLADSQ